MLLSTSRCINVNLNQLVSASIIHMHMHSSGTETDDTASETCTFNIPLLCQNASVSTTYDNVAVVNYRN